MDPSRLLASIKHIIAIDFVMNERLDWSCVEIEWSVSFSSAARDSWLRFEYANIEALIEILSQHCLCNLMTDLVSHVLKFIVKLIKLWMNYDDNVLEIRIGDAWSYDAYVHEISTLTWASNTTFLFEVFGFINFECLLILVQLLTCIINHERCSRPTRSRFLTWQFSKV